MAELKCLTGPSRVRDRVSIIYGSNDHIGAENALASLLEVFAMAGQTQKLEVRLHPDSSISVISLDEGIHLGSAGDGGSAWRDLFCNLYSEPSYYLSKMYGRGFQPAFVPVRPGLCPLTAVQYLCESFEVISTRRDGFEYRIRFEKGDSIGELEQFQTKESPHTTIHLAFDHELFDMTNMRAEFRDRIGRLLGQLLEYSNNLEYEVVEEV